METTGRGLLQDYIATYKSRVTSIKGSNISCNTEGDFSWLLASGCHGNTQDTLVSAVGFTTGPLWVLGHFLILTANGKKRANKKRPPWVTWSLLPHCIADVISCVGAILAMQYFPQIVFAVVVMCVHSAAVVMILAYHMWCRTTKYDMQGETLVKKGCTIPTCFFSPMKSCPLSLCAMISFVACGVQAISNDGLVSKEGVHTTKQALTLTWWEVTGQTLGAVACLAHWLASGYDVISTYRASWCYKRQMAGVVLMILANCGYLLSVYGREAGVTLHTVPWTVARLGLLGMNTGMLIQISRTAKRQDHHEPKDASVDESLLSSSSDSEASGSNVLWESTWKQHLRKTSFRMASLPKLQAVTPVYPMFSNVGSGRPAQPQSRAVAYDLLQSTDTSCSRTAEQDTETEFELDHPLSLTIATRTSEFNHISEESPEARHHRVVQWVQKSSPEDERHPADLLQIEGRQHSGSFSQCRSVPSVPNSRKNSAIF